MGFWTDGVDPDPDLIRTSGAATSDLWLDNLLFRLLEDDDEIDTVIARLIDSALGDVGRNGGDQLETEPEE